MDADWKLRDLEYTVTPELKRNIRSLQEYRELHEDRIKELEISLEHVLDRLYKLEEKERQRVYIERDEHEQDVSE